jgi:hypothetical protein
VDTPPSARGVGARWRTLRPHDGYREGGRRSDERVDHSADPGHLGGKVERRHQGGRDRRLVGDDGSALQQSTKKEDERDEVDRESYGRLIGPSSKSRWASI